MTSISSVFDGIGSLGSASQEPLPPGFLPFEEFSRKFSLGATSTEKGNEKTASFSQTMQVDPSAGIRMLWEADGEVLTGFEKFLPVIDSLSPRFAERIQKGGRVFLVGSGSSGRVGIDIAAKCEKVAQNEVVRGVIAGGDSAMVRAREGFEDSELDGEECLKALNVKSLDTVILISSSGSAPFLVGCGHEAANRGAEVYYFYNSKEIPSRTRLLFNRVNNPVRPLELDIGPQSIAGSTRLQGASLEECALGALLGAAVLRSIGRNEEAVQYPRELLSKMREGYVLLSKHLKTIAAFAKKEAAVFLSDRSNCYRLRDETQEGYVTLIGDKNSIRESLIDVTEMSPTFSMNPVQRESEVHQKRSEYRAYLAGVEDNRAAWKALLGREMKKGESADVFLLAKNGSGNHSFAKRPTGQGNFVIGVAKVGHLSEISKEIWDSLSETIRSGGDAGVIALCRSSGSISFGQMPALVLEGVPTDLFGISETLLLKQILNLISNGSMALLNKVYGNRMIDVRTSNHKFVDRAIRLIKETWQSSNRTMPWDDRKLYYCIAKLSAWKASTSASGIYSPSVVKMILAMLHLGKEAMPKGFQEAAAFLAEKKENLSFLSDNYTLCIDGGGSKTLLQVLDHKGEIVSLYKQERELQGIEAGASNINVVKEEGVRKAFEKLFKEVKVGPEKRDLKDILANTKVIAGMAGVGVAKNFQTVSSLFEECGVSSSKLLLMTDAELVLRLLKGNGIVLISGTGSICFAEKDGVRQRVGGLGRILGDEGSGYQIGLQAIRAGLAEEFGYGPSTKLTEPLRAFFGVKELKALLPCINSLEMSSSEIANAAPFVFEMAEAKDPVAERIISKAADDLLELLRTALKITKLQGCELHLWGGTFKGAFADVIIQKLKTETDWENITIVNQSDKNAAVVFAKMFN